MLDRRRAIMALGVAFCVPLRGIARVSGVSQRWTRLPTDVFKGKQDDIFFVTRDLGWYGNGRGRIYRTRDGGNSWTKLVEKPGTFVRAIGFVDEKVGVFGNIGPGSFPDVTDTNPLYRTVDGGETWSAVNRIEGPRPAGICAIDVLRQPFVNSGVLDHRVTLRAGGRVGGPAFLLTSKDLGESWISEDLGRHVSMILDVKFLNERVGFIAGASDADVSVSNAVVIKTVDGGATWREVYRSRRPCEITWKMSFPSRRTGYVTIQNYDDDVANVQRVVAKTVDGGESWTEMPLARDHDFRELGVVFIDDRRGWVGTTHGGFSTEDGGKSWSPVDMGSAVNKIRVVRDATGTRLFAIGREVWRLDLPPRS